MLKSLKNIFIIVSSTIFLFISCSSNSTSNNEEEIDHSTLAEIVSVTTSGDENNYTFSVGVLSPDTGCEQYANWWEVVSENGDLIYRRILGHSHVNEQPFVRSGGIVPINQNEIVIIRAHMNTSGFGVKTFKGSIANGFNAFETSSSFATNLATVDPLPTNCAF